MGTLYRSGRILTMVDQDDAPEAVLVRGGRIAVVGSLAEARAAAEPGDAEIDLAGRTLMPAFIDPHGHLLMHGVLATLVDLEHATNMDDIVAAFRTELDARGGGDDRPLVGVKYDPSSLAEQRHPTRHDLDRVGEGQKVLAMHRSLHVGVASSALLAAAGVTAETPDPEGARFGREADGRTPDGYLEEHGALGALAAAMTPEGGAPGLIPGVSASGTSAVRAAVDDYLRHGITTAQEGAADPASVERLASVAREGGIGIDLVVYPVATNGVDSFAAHPELASGYAGGLRLGGCKLILDGSPQARSAWMSEPYEPAEGQDPDFRGYPILTDAQVDDAVRRVAGAGRQLIVHCNGDAAAEQWISAFERAVADDPAISGTRPVMIHAQTVRDDQLDRMARIGMIASVFSGHTYYWGDVHLRNFGPVRGRRVSPARSALDRGVRVTLHQDAPVTPPDMIHTVWASVNRITRSGRPIGLEQRISTWEALRAVTAEAAYQYGEEATKGTIEPGKRADLVVLSADPLATAPNDLLGIEVLTTVKDGEVVFER